MNAPARNSLTLQDDPSPNSSEIGIAVTTPPYDPPPPPTVRLIGHPYATPSYTMLPKQHRVQVSADISSRHRLPPHEQHSPPPSKIMTELPVDQFLSPDYERSSRRDSYLGAYAYAATDDTDDTIIDFGEALQRSIKRSSGSSSGHSYKPVSSNGHQTSSNHNNHIHRPNANNGQKPSFNHGHLSDQPHTRDGRQERPMLQVRSALASRPPPAPVRFEPVKFDKSQVQETSRGLSPITDVTTPASSISHPRSIITPDGNAGMTTPPPMPVRKVSDEDEKLDKSTESHRVMSTTDSSPVSTDEPPLLGKASFDSIKYRGLFFKPSRTNPPDPTIGSSGSRKGKEREGSSVTQASLGMEAAALHDQSQAQGHSGKMSLDIPESVGNSTQYAESDGSLSPIDTTEGEN